MEHRYGRHGPRAWLRQRQRRYGRPSLLPVPVESQPTVVRVFVPSNAERIIFIVIQGTQDPNEEEQYVTSTEIEAIKLRSLSPPSPPSPPTVVATQSADDNPIANQAGIQAFEDLEEIGSLEEEGIVVLIDRDRVIKRAVGLAKTHVNEYFTKENRPALSEYKRLRRVYSDSYMASFDEELQEVSGGIEYLHSEEEIRIRRFAIQDKNEAPLDYKRSDYKKPYHKRDLAVVRVLQVLEIPLDTAREYLPRMHDLADKYEEYFNNPKEEVIWPRDQDLF